MVTHSPLGALCTSIRHARLRTHPTVRAVHARRLPLFLLASFVGPIDDPVRRDIRKLGAGRETGFVYHRAKAALMPLAVLPWGHLPCRRCHCIPC